MRGSSDALARVWLPALFEVSPERAVGHLEAICAAAGIARENQAVAWFARLFGGLRHGTGVNLDGPAMTPSLLLRLLRLSYKHVERGVDAAHEGSFSPDLRDDAETARNMLLTAAMDLGGAEGWAAKQEIANDPAFSHIRDRLHALAIDKSAREADNLAMRPDEVVKLDAKKEPGPRTPAEMFALMTDRFDDLRDHLLGDASPREMWALARDERVMRRAIGEHLERDARGAYLVGQEGVTAEEKETDIRMRSTVNAIEGVIELKVGDKRYSAADLRKVLSDQLVAKYLAPAGRRAGLLVITRAQRDLWENPDTGKPLDFAGLIAMLRADAKALEDCFPDEIHIDVVGLDLKPRLKTEREAKAESRSGLPSDLEQSQAVPLDAEVPVWTKESNDEP